MPVYKKPMRKRSKRQVQREKAQAMQVKKGNAGDALRRAQWGKRRKSGPK